MAKSEKCTHCGAEILSVVYFGADNAPVGGHQVCTNCGPRSVVEVELKLKAASAPKTQSRNAA